ncbi:MAG: YfcE family phosphodiesterase [Erysipelotrichaceae bacterium]|nr:YfcE family phosphodiesterase [Erysipelotrichaceae bacterium]
MSEVRIVLVSDNHGDPESLRWLRETYADYDYFVHCGDSIMSIDEMDGFICVCGNNDFQYGSAVPDQQILEAGGHRIYICHGHMDFISYYHYSTMAKRAAAKNCDLVFFGHVHTVHDEVCEGVRLLNPGSILHNRDGSPPSYMLVHLDGPDVKVQVMAYGSSKPQPDTWLTKLIQWLSGL